jgi:pilus assembly protein CpaE
LKIAVISPNPAHLEDIGRYLQAQDGSRVIALHEGGMTRLRVVADQQRPDLVILDSMCRDLEELPALEYVNAQHPHTVVIVLCANQSPEFLINAMRAGVREVLPSPVTKEGLLAAVERIEQRLGLGAKPREPGEVIAFIPCKGGSGATFLATNLGYQLAAEQKRVILIDLNLQFGDAVLFVHDHKPAMNLGDVARNIHRLDASFLAGSLVNVSPNYGVLAAPEDPGQAMEVKPEHIDVLVNLAANHYDFVILDVGRVLDGITMKALDRANHIFPVMQLTLPFIRDANRMLAAFRMLGYSKDKIRLLVNRFEKSGEIRLEDVERSLGLASYKTLPNSYETVAAAVNHGQPIASFARSNPVAKGLQELAQALIRPPTAANGLLGKLLRRA